MATKRTDVELAISARDEFSATFKEFNELVKKTNKAVVDGGRAAGASAKDVKALDTQYAILKTTLDALKDSIATDKATKKSIKAFQGQENALKRVESQLVKAQAAYDKARAAAFQLSKTNAGVSPTARANLEASLLTVKRLTTTQTQYRAQLERTTATLKRAGVDTTALDARLARLGLRLENNEAKARQLGAALKSYSGSAKVAGFNTRLFNDETRKALNVTQRLRGQVLALVSAYVGLHGIANEVRNVFRVASDERASEIRFNVAAGGDTEKAAAEMAFVREEADRLKLEYISLAKEYSKFTSALPPGAITIEQQRKVLSAYGTAARVAGLSTDELQGIFKALRDIISKGNLSAEEAKQQLGDRLPGAINIMAAGLGFGADRLEEFYKLMEQGGIDGVKAVVGSADELIKKYGEELPAALDSPQAALADFQNELSKLRLEVANSGFLGDLTKALTSVTAALQDPQTVEALKEFSAFLGEIIKTLPAIIPYLDEMATGLAVIVALGFANYLRRIFVELGGMVIVGKVTFLFANFSKVMAALPALVSAVGAELALLGGAFAVVGLAVVKVGQLVEAMIEARDQQRKMSADIQATNDKIKKQAAEGFFTDLAGKSKKELEEIADATRAMAVEIDEALTKAKFQAEETLFLTDADNEEARKQVEELTATYDWYFSYLIAANTRLAEINRNTEAVIPNAVIASSQDSIEGLSQSLLDLTSLSLDSEVAGLNAEFEALSRALKDNDANAEALVGLEARRVERVLAIERERSAQIIKIRATELSSKLELLEREGVKDDELLAEQRALVTELADFRIAETRRGLDGVRTELDKATAQERSFADKVKGLNKSIGDERLRQDQVLRDFRRAGLSEEAAFYDRRRELAELASQTERALEAGDFKLAEELARKREALAIELGNTEVKSEETGRTLVSLERNRLRFGIDLRNAHDQINRAMAGQKDNAEAAQLKQQELVQNLTASLDTLSGTLEELIGDKIVLDISLNEQELKDRIAALRDEATRGGVLMKVGLDAESAKATLLELQKPTESTHTVRLILDRNGIPRAVVGFKDGGAVQGFAKGGPVPGFAGGGRVHGPGTSTSDSILARLSRGEFVNTARSVRFWGESFFADLNALRMPRLPFPRFAHGGPVSRSGSSGGSGGGRVDRVALDLTINGNPLGEVTGSRSTIDGLIAGLSELRR